MADQPRSRDGFVLGIDLGTTYSAAAIGRGSTVEACVLGTIAAQIPSVVLHREDSEILTGEAAERRAGNEPTRAAREFKRRLGDPVPIIVGGTPYGAEALMAEMLEAIVRQVTEREGDSPTTIVLTHPANYGEYKRGLLHEAALLAGLDLDRVRLITEPEAAAIAYAHQQRIDPGEIIAVYDFGGGTFDAAVVRDTAEGFELIGTPEGMERLGGIDFDQAVLSHVDTVLDGLVSSADSSDAQVVAGQARLRDDCRRAKEALSNDTDATIAVAIPGVQTAVRLTRDELEQMVRPRIAETVKALERTIASAGITTNEVSRVLLVGGSSRMPIVAQVIRESIDRPVSVDADPKLTIAIGAALSAMPRSSGQTEVAAAPAAVPTSAQPTPDRSADGALSSARRRRLGVAGVAAASVVAAAAIAVVLRNGDDPKLASGSTFTSAALSPATVRTAGTAGTVTVASTANTSGAGASTAVSTSPSQAGGVEAVAGVVERLAFDGSVDGSGIPGPALQAGVPGALTGLAVAPNGDVIVASASPSIVKVSGGQAVVVGELSAGQAPAGGITIGSDGAIFVATRAGIVHIVGGISSLILDGPAAGLSGDLGPLALDGGGNLYIADNGGSRIIRRAPDGSLTLVAGTGNPATADSTVVDGGPAATADIGLVTGLVVDRDGNLLIADNGVRRVRAVARDGTITTVAGGGALDLRTVAAAPPANRAEAADVALASVAGIAVDVHRRIYVADGLSRAIVRFGSDGVVEVALADVDVTAFALSRSGALIFSDGRTLWSVLGVDGTP